MRIEEMKPGILHLRKKMEDDGQQEFYQPDPSDAAFAAEQAAEIDLPTIESELSEPRWSLVSFDSHEAGGLTYPQAIALMSELDAVGIAGLCIITDEAASRLKS
jgi:hypothetical protein